MSRTRLILILLLLGLTVPIMAAVPGARADVHLVRINEFYTQCDNGATAVQYIELRDYTISQFFRQCASLEVRRTVGGSVVWSALPVFAGRGDGEAFPANRTWLIATPAFQARTGIVPDLTMPDGTLDPAGGVIRLAADPGNGCVTTWGTIHEVRYGDQTLASPNIPAPGRHLAANYNNATLSWSIGTRTPRTFANVTTSTWTCDSQSPTVTVIAANGGENWEAGSSQDITWTAADDVGVTSILLEFSANNGASYTQIAAGEPNDGTFSWSVPATVTTQGLIRVTAADAVNNMTSDVSDAVFTIQAASAVPWLPREIRAPLLLQNRPNPFNPVTQIGFGLPASGRARVSIYTMDGRLVRELADGTFNAGYNELRWDGRDAAGKSVPSGVYLYALDTDGRRQTRKLTLSK